MARTSTTEAILTLAAEMREGNAQLVAWLQQSSERQERQNQATIVALSEISKGQERLQQGQERIAQGQEQIAQGTGADRARTGADRASRGGQHESACNHAARIASAHGTHVRGSPETDFGKRCGKREGNIEQA